jgi:hypothetical protein
VSAPLTRERELRKAVRQARLPPRDFKIFTVLLDRADFKTAEIPGRFQPKSLDALAGLCEMSMATLCRGLAHLEAEGWLKRGRSAGGRGCPTWYTLTLGGRCYCSGPGRPRKRKTLSQFPAETVSEIRPKLSHQRELNRLRNSDKPARQAPVSAEGNAAGGRVGGSASEKEPAWGAHPWAPACQKCGGPVSELDAALGLECGRCKAAGKRPRPGDWPAGEPGGPAAAPGPVPGRVLCPVCGIRMDPVLPREGYRAHPWCEEAGGLPRSKGSARPREGRRQ